MGKPESEMGGTEAWVHHHYERGRLAAEKDFLSFGLRKRWFGDDQRNADMERRSWLRTMAELLEVTDD